MSIETDVWLLGKCSFKRTSMYSLANCDL
jgi:hypothetical protein